jgi:hypothetical protein
MGRIASTLDDAATEFIQAQSIFFVASAPLAADGHINVSPKGLDTLRILSPNTVAYLDLTGSGVETIAHLKENGRIILMFCAFQGPPKILRLHGRGRVLEPFDPEYGNVAALFPAYESARSVIVVELERVSTSCGYAVPLMKYEADRQQSFKWASHKGPAGLKAYRQEKNRRSLDGLPGLSEP